MDVYFERQLRLSKKNGQRRAMLGLVIVLCGIAIVLIVPYFILNSTINAVALTACSIVCFILFKLFMIIKFEKKLVVEPSEILSTITQLKSGSDNKNALDYLHSVIESGVIIRHEHIRKAYDIWERDKAITNEMDLHQKTIDEGKSILTLLGDETLTSPEASNCKIENKEGRNEQIA